MGSRGAGRTRFPRIVFEVAFSQSDDSVLEDARQWLMRSHGAITLCVIVQLEEQPTNFTEVDEPEMHPKLDDQEQVVSCPGAFVHDETGQDDVPSPEACTISSVSWWTMNA